MTDDEPIDAFDTGPAANSTPRPRGRPSGKTDGKRCTSPGCYSKSLPGYRFCTFHMAAAKSAMAREGYLTNTDDPPPGERM